MKKIEGVPHRLQLIRNGETLLIDDAYNSNPAGTRAALETLGFFEEHFKILVTPGMVELGAKQDEYNEAFGADAARVCDHIILVGRKQAPPIEKGALGAGMQAIWMDYGTFFCLKGNNRKSMNRRRYHTGGVYPDRADKRAGQAEGGAA